MKLSRKHSLSVDGWKSSLSLEDPFWNAFKEIAGREGKEIATLAMEVDAKRNPHEFLSAAIRVFVLKDAMRRAKEGERSVEINQEHITRLQIAIDVLMSRGNQEAREGLAPIPAVIAGGRPNA